MKNILDKEIGELTAQEVAHEVAKALGRFNISITNPQRKRKKFKSNNLNYAKAVKKNDKKYGF